MPEGGITGSFDSGPAPGIGVTPEWVSCGVFRALALKYAAGEGEKPPQTKAVSDSRLVPDFNLAGVPEDG
ncbi:MAG: hypothetical protein M0Z41_14240 [Peptococcaceae bacterium]|jgi:hypothetical protein|nr:hypothetical protein [Peptococcaceae bacterium]